MPGQRAEDYDVESEGVTAAERSGEYNRRFLCNDAAQFDYVVGPEEFGTQWPAYQASSNPTTPRS